MVIVTLLYHVFPLDSFGPFISRLAGWCPCPPQLQVGLINHSNSKYDISTINHSEMGVFSTNLANELGHHLVDDLRFSYVPIQTWICRFLPHWSIRTATYPGGRGGWRGKSQRMRRVFFIVKHSQV